MEALRELYEEKEQIEGFIEKFQEDEVLSPETKRALLNECNADLARVKQDQGRNEGSREEEPVTLFGATRLGCSGNMGHVSVICHILR